MRNKIYALIIDDEAGNRENLKRMIDEYCPQIILLAECSSVEEARKEILYKKPDLIFLDICMTDGTGFDLLEQLADISFEVIFVTAYDQYAIRAIRFSALDYLLKPIDSRELVNAVERASRVILRKQHDFRMQNLISNNHREDRNKKIALSVADKIEFVEINDIIRCESEDNYTTFFLREGKKLVVSKTLKEFDELLTPYHFLRVHQSHLVNLNEIRSFIKSEGGYIKMSEGTSVPISRQRRTQVMEAIKLI